MFIKLRDNIQIFLKKDLIKVTSLTGISTIIKMVSQLIISKVIVLLVGPAGLVMFGQLINISTIFQTLSVGGITVGVTKYLAEYEEEPINKRKVIATSVKLTFYCSLITSLGILLFYKQISEKFFQNQSYEFIVLLMGGTIAFAGFNTLFIAIINGFKKYKQFVRVSIINSIIGLVFTIALTYYFSIYGALIAYVISPALTFLYSFYVIKKDAELNKSIYSIPIDKGITKKLSSYAIMLINNSLVGSTAQIIIRLLLINKLSENAAGIWEAMNRLSGAYLLIIQSSIQVYYLPTLASLKDKVSITKEIISAQKIIIPLCIVGFVAIYFLRMPIIHILFSKEFDVLGDLIIFQLVGDTIKIAAWLIAYVMYARSMTKALVLSDNLFTIINIAIIYLLIDATGIESIYFAYIINSAIYLLFMIVFYKYFMFKKPATQ